MLTRYRLWSLVFPYGRYIHGIIEVFAIDDHIAGKATGNAQLVAIIAEHGAVIGAAGMYFVHGLLLESVLLDVRAGSAATVVLQCADGVSDTGRIFAVLILLASGKKQYGAKRREDSLFHVVKF